MAKKGLYHCLVVAQTEVCDKDNGEETIFGYVCSFTRYRIHFNNDHVYIVFKYDMKTGK